MSHLLPYRLITVNGFSVPATHHDAIKKIMSGVERGEIAMKARKRYQHLSGAVCAIGYLFTGAQIDKIRSSRNMRTELAGVADQFGRQNVETMTGMRLKDAREVQKMFDSCHSLEDFKAKMRHILNSRVNYNNPGVTGLAAFPVSGE